MDFLKNIAKGVYSTLNPIVNKVSGAVSSINTGLKNVAKSTANAASAYTVNQVQANQQASQPLVQNQTALPYGSYPAFPTSTQSQTYAPTTTQNQMSYDPSLNSSGMSVSPDFLFLGNARPSSIGQVDQFGRKSTKQQGQAYQELVGDEYRTVIPQTAFSGLSGGDSGQSFASFAPTGTTGTTGTGGFGSVSSGNALGTSTVSAPQTEDEIKKQEMDRIKKAKALIELAPGGMTSLYGADGKTLSQKGGGVSEPTADMNVQVPTGGNFNVSQLDALKSATSKLISNPASLTSSDIGTLNSNLDSLFAIARQAQDAQQPTPENVVIDTPSQDAFINSSQDPFGTRQLMDEWKSANTDLKNLQTNRIDLIKNINALNQAYTPILDDIKSNPNLPKALAARRLDEVQKKQKTVLEGFVNQLELVNQSISDQNETVNRAFNIAKFAQDQSQTQQSNNMTKLKLFIDSGAIGAFTDADIKKYAAQTGLEESQLKAIRSKAKSPELSIITETDANGTVRGIDKNTGNTVWSLSGAGKPAQPVDVKEFQGQYATFANRLEQGIPILAQLVPAIQGYDPVKLQAAITASDFAPVLANKLIPDNVKSYLQAARNVINAVLRKESGAVISPSEFQTARAQYLVMPGDSNDIVKQKNDTLNINLTNYKRAAGGAYLPFSSGTQSQTSNTTTNYTSILDSILNSQ